MHRTLSVCTFIDRECKVIADFLRLRGGGGRPHFHDELSFTNCEGILRPMFKKKNQKKKITVFHKLIRRKVTIFHD